MTLIFFLDFRKLKDGFHRSIDSDRTAVQAKVIASGVTPFLIGIVIILNFPHQHGVLNLENSIFQPLKKA